MTGPRRQRGTAAVFAGISLLALLAAVALVIDIGNLYFAQRDLQNKANLAALDTVRMSSGCYSEVTDPDEAAEVAARDSLERNGAPMEWLRNVRIGTPVSDSAGLRSFQPERDERTFAVQVQLARPSPARLLGRDRDAAGAPRLLQARAAATSTNDVTISAGSFLARFSPTGSGALLEGVIPGIGLDVLSFNTLLDAQVELLAIAEEGAIATLSEFFFEETPLPSFLDAIGAVLTAGGNSVAGGIMQASDMASLAGETLVPVELFNVEDNLSPLLSGAAVSAGDLVTAAVQNVLVNGALELLIELGGGREVQLTVREAPVIDIGPPGTRPDGEELTESRTAQARLRSGIPLSGLLPGDSEITLFIEAASARAAVTGVRCPQADSPEPQVRVRSSSTATEIGIEPISIPIRLGELQQALGLSQSQLLQMVTGSSGLLCGGLLGGLLGPICNVLNNNPLLQIDISMQPLRIPGAPPDERWVTGPFPRSFPIDAPASAPLAGLVANELDVRIAVAGGSLPTGVLGDIVNALNPLLEVALVDTVGPEVDALLDPLLEGLGISLVGANITVSSVSIRRPQLFTTVEQR